MNLTNKYQHQMDLNGSALNHIDVLNQEIYF